MGLNGTSTVQRRRVSVRGCLIAASTLLVGGGVLLVTLRPVQLRYYEWQMRRARFQAYERTKRIEDGFVVAHVPREAEKRYEYYRAKVEELKGLVRRHYIFKHLWVPTKESEGFSRLLVLRCCPNYVDFSSNYPEEPEPMELTVWCKPEDVAAWDDFVARHDVSGDRGVLARGSGAVQESEARSDAGRGLKQPVPSATEVGVPR